MVPNREKAFNKLKNLGNILDSEGLDLLNLCLKMNPSERPPAAYLLKHPFFDEIRDEMTVKYLGTTCCFKDSCENSGLYTIPYLNECHALSYFNNKKKIENELRPMSNFLS